MATPTRSRRVDPAVVMDSLYEAALQPELVPKALHVYARAFNGTSGNIIGMGDHQGRVLISPDGEEGAKAYAAGWWQQDFVTERGLARKMRGLVSDLDLATTGEMAAHPFYQEFARQFHTYFMCTYAVQRPGAAAPFAVSIRRAEQFGPFGPEESREIAPLARHAARAFDLAVKLSNAECQARGLCEALTHLGYGVIGLGSSGRVLFSNTVADQIGTDGIRISSGAVLAAAPAEQRALDLLVSETLALADGRTALPPRPVLLRRPSGRVPAVVYGIPVPPRQGHILMLFGGQPRALLVIIEPDAERQHDLTLLQELFGMSPGEARVAGAIATGLTTRESAVQLGITEGTLRIVLKRVFQKVGVSRQAELVLQLAPLLKRK